MTAMGHWIEQFLRNGVPFQPPVARRAECGMTERVIAFKDPDGLQLELVGVADRHSDESGTISDEYAIRGFYGVTLWLEETRPTSKVLAEVLGFRSRRNFSPVTGSWMSIIRSGRTRSQRKHPLLRVPAVLR
jgi:glyoxalase family protein